MRDDTSEVGKKQYAAARSAYRGKHGDVNEHEFPDDTSPIAQRYTKYQLWAWSKHSAQAV